MPDQWPSQGYWTMSSLAEVGPSSLRTIAFLGQCLLFGTVLAQNRRNGGKLVLLKLALDDILSRPGPTSITDSDGLSAHLSQCPILVALPSWDSSEVWASGVFTIHHAHVPIRVDSIIVVIVVVVVVAFLIILVLLIIVMLCDNAAHQTMGTKLFAGLCIMG